jgi:aldose 1-epimerase
LFHIFSIAGGTFHLNNSTYTLATNNGPNALHGGMRGWSHRLWSISDINDEDVASPSITFTLISPHLEEGYPGSLMVSVTYVLTDGGVELLYHARLLPTGISPSLPSSNTYEPDTSSSGGGGGGGGGLDTAELVMTGFETPINMTNHTYFHLAPSSTEPTILNHCLQIHANQYLELDATSIPTGRLLDVLDCPAMDFTKRRRIGEAIEKVAPGYDHCYLSPSMPTVSGTSIFLFHRNCELQVLNFSLYTRPE